MSGCALRGVMRSPPWAARQMLELVWGLGAEFRWCLRCVLCILSQGVKGLRAHH